MGKICEVLMHLTLEFEGKEARSKFNQEEFLREIQAEIDKFTGTVESANAKKSVKEAPDGAQGAEELILWVIELAASPEMIPTYLRAFVAAVNEICRSKSQPAQIPESEEVKEEGQALDLKPKDYLVSLKAAGKAMTLPATGAALKKFVSEVSQG